MTRNELMERLRDQLGYVVDAVNEREIQWVKRERPDGTVVCIGAEHSDTGRVWLTVYASVTDYERDDPTTTGAIVADRELNPLTAFYVAVGINACG